jgi:hypothetical protein
VLCSGTECALWDGKRLAYTVEEAAERLQIGRTLAYQQTKLYLTTGGRDGIPAINVSGLVRVPVPGLLIYAFTGRVPSPEELEEFVNDLLGRPNPRLATAAVAGEDSWIPSPQVGSGGRPGGVAALRLSS